MSKEMRKLLLIQLALTLLAGCRPPGQPQEPANQLNVVRKAWLFAYPQFEHDAVVFGKFLRSLSYDVSIYSGEAFTESQVRWIFKMLREQPVPVPQSPGDGVALIYFTTHGGRMIDAPPRDESDGLDEYLVTGCEEEITDDELAEFGRTLVPTCIIIDACYSGGMYKATHKSGGESWAEGIIDKRVYPADILIPPNYAIMASSQPEEISWGPFGPYDTSLFTYCLHHAMDQLAWSSQVFVVAASQTRRLSGGKMNPCMESSGEPLLIGNLLAIDIGESDE